MLNKGVNMVNKLFRGLAVIPIMVMLVIMVATPAWATDLRGSTDAIVIASGEVIDDDLYLAANRVVINGTVNGDVLCAGSTIIVDGIINGNIMAIGSTININGQVTHSARVVGSTINISGNIGGDLVVAGSTVDLARGTEIGRDLVFAADQIDIDTLIGSDIQGWGNRVNLNDGVIGNVEVGAERLKITNTANIQGNLIYTSENEADIDPGATIGGTISHKLREIREPIIPNIGPWVRVIAFLMTLITGIVIILIAPKRARAVAASIKHKPLLSLGWGAIVLVATPIAAIVAFITVVGVPVGLLGLAIYGAAVYISQIVVGLFIGYWIIGYFNKVESRGVLVGAFALGFFILTLIKLIPYVGLPIWLATVLFGIGAMAISQKTMKAEAPVEVISAV
jgi:cytoskeletal protein CcmA (bactofilin family)